MKAEKTAQTRLTLLRCPLNNAFFYRAFADKPVDGHLLCLPETMGSVHRLLVYSWIPITIVEYHLQSVQTSFKHSPLKWRLMFKQL